MDRSPRFRATCIFVLTMTHPHSLLLFPILKEAHFNYNLQYCCCCKIKSYLPKKLHYWSNSILSFCSNSLTFIIQELRYKFLTIPSSTPIFYSYHLFSNSNLSFPIFTQNPDMKSTHNFLGIHFHTTSNDQHSAGRLGGSNDHVLTQAFEWSCQCLTTCKSDGRWWWTEPHITLSIEVHTEHSAVHRNCLGIQTHTFPS